MPQGIHPVYTHEFKLNAVALFYDKGTYKAVGEELRVDQKTIASWVRAPEGQKMLIKMREDMEEELRHKYAIIIHKGMDGLNDRLDNGNVKTALVNGDVKEWREPMNSKDLTYTTGIMIDKFRVSMNQPTRISKSTDGGASLLEDFEAIANKVIEKRVDQSIPGEAKKIN
jgi:hypothetical protein